MRSVATLVITISPPARDNPPVFCIPDKTEKPHLVKMQSGTRGVTDGGGNLEGRPGYQRN